MNISIAQAVDVWTELERAYRGESGYGGNVSEMYAYRVMPFNPSVHRNPNPEPDSLFYDDWLAMGVQAGDSLRDLLRLFQRHHEDAIIEIEAPEGWVPYSDWDMSFHHRVHIRFTLSRRSCGDLVLRCGKRIAEADSKAALIGGQMAGGPPCLRCFLEER